MKYCDQCQLPSECSQKRKCVKGTLAKEEAEARRSAAAGSAFLRDQIANLRSAGWIAHAKEFETAIIALQVISTWATFDGGSALVPAHVEQLCAKALRPFRSQPSKAKKQNDQVEARRK